MLYPQNNICRRTWKLDGYWGFATDPDGTGIERGYPRGIPGGRRIAVPASWNEQANDLYHYDGRAWYQTDFPLGALSDSERVLLRFSSVQYRCEVFVNGVPVGTNSRPYLPFEFDVTEQAVENSENRLVVAVDGKLAEDEPVNICDFYGFAGIARPVFLSVVNAERIEDITAETSLKDGSGVLSLRISAPGAERVTARIGDGTAELRPEEEYFAGTLTVGSVIPWSCEDPHLYTLEVRAYAEGGLADTYRLRIGFREIRIEGRKILLNGSPVFLKGFGKHEDFAVIGKGLSHAVNVRDFDLMKWAGANSFRTSHYPYSEEILELADETGFLVVDEAPFAGIRDSQFRDPEVRRKALSYMETLIARDKNHPCVLSWSVGNECQSDCASAPGFFLPVIELARRLDSRPVTYVAWTRPEEDLIYDHVDIIGLNRYYGWYPYENWPGSAEPGDLGEALRQMDECLETFAKRYPGPLLVTEFGAEAIPGFHSPFLLQFTEEFQSEFLSEYIRLFLSKPYLCGMHIWNFADFATGQNPGRVMGNRKGVFTRDRQPKQAAFTVRRLWTGKEDSGLTSRSRRPGAGAPSHKVPGL